MSKAGLDNRHRNHDGEISRKHGNTLIHTLRKTYGPRFAPGCADHAKLSDVVRKLDELSLSHLIRDHEAGKLEQICAGNSGQRCWIGTDCLMRQEVKAACPSLRQQRCG